MAGHYTIMTHRAGTLIPSLARSFTHLCDGVGAFNEVPHSFSRSVASDMLSVEKLPYSLPCQTRSHHLEAYK